MHAEWYPQVLGNLYGLAEPRARRHGRRRCHDAVAESGRDALVHRVAHAEVVAPHYQPDLLRRVHACITGPAKPRLEPDSPKSLMPGWVAPEEGREADPGRLVICGADLRTERESGLFGAAILRQQGSTGPPQRMADDFRVRDVVLAGCA